LTASKLFELEPKDCIVFEDSFNGLKSGRAAGMKVIGLSTTNTPEAIKPYSDMVIADYSKLSIETCESLL
jgi:beta-phosphoglucomutase-like phosphatase (HAD superfamily)